MIGGKGARLAAKHVAGKLIEHNDQGQQRSRLAALGVKLAVSGRLIGRHESLAYAGIELRVVRIPKFFHSRSEQEIKDGLVILVHLSRRAAYRAVICGSRGAAFRAVTSSASPISGLVGVLGEGGKVSPLLCDRCATGESVKYSDSAEASSRNSTAMHIFGPRDSFDRQPVKNVAISS
jgi:hypothetical protein